MKAIKQNLGMKPNYEVIHENNYRSENEIYIEPL